MSKLALTTIAFLSIPLAPATAFAGSPMTDPVYFGIRSADAEKETYAYPGVFRAGERIVVVGAAHRVGPLMGDAEKDTIGYQVLLAPESAVVTSIEPSR